MTGHPFDEQRSFLFSFIIPCCNVEKYLPEAIESVIAQSIGFKDNIQIVLVNDGSADGTEALCKRHHDLWPDNIVHIDRPNGGASSARNAGMRAATGQYINFLDADAKWDAGACRAALDFFEKNTNINFVCFPIRLLDPNRGKHWLNDKFTRTRAANILKDPDCVVFDLSSCFCAREVVKSRPFAENPPVPDEKIWLAKVLLDERDFGLIAKPSCDCRLGPNSAAETALLPPSLYPEALRQGPVELLRYAKEQYGETPEWAQYAAMLDLTGRFREEDRNILPPSLKAEYRSLMRDCLEQMDDRIIRTARNLWTEERILAFALKYGTTCEQIKRWVKPDAGKKAMRFVRPGSEPAPFSSPRDIRVNFMDIAKGCLLLRGTCAVSVAPPERIRLVLTAGFPDESVREYPCALVRRPDLKRRRLVLPEDLWPREGFELSLPLADLADKAEIRAFVEIDGIRFDLQWRHMSGSPFARGDGRLSLERAGHTVSRLPDDAGLRVESWKHDGGFLFSFIIPCGNVKPHLAETVESVIAQSVDFEENIQIVLVNDGASDEVITACEDCLDLYPNNIIFIKNLANASLNAARNAGLGAAAGRYINFLEPGDKWDPEACRAALDFFEENPKVKIACFPVQMLDPNRGRHWLNYKFATTRVANIFRDPECAVFDLCSCFCAREVVKGHPFAENSPVPEDWVRLAEMLLDERDFGLVAKPPCRRRFGRNSAAEPAPLPPSLLPEALRLGPLALLRHAKEQYGDTPDWAQHTAMFDLIRRLREEDGNIGNILSPSLKAEYRSLMRDCLERIDDRIICTARELWPEERLCALAVKHGATYERMKERVTADEAGRVLFRRGSDAEAVPFADKDRLRLEFMDIAKGCLLLRGSCAVPVAPPERIRLVLTAGFPDESVREYPCEPVRRPDLKRRRLVLPEDLWPLEGFELSLPLADLADKAEIRAFVEIDGIRFDLKWRHMSGSPFARGDERLSLERAGHTVSRLPDDAGLRVESWKHDGGFLFSFIIPAYNVEAYLAEAVESVIAQSVDFEENIQIVLVNDGSADGTGAVCEHYRDLYPDNIVYIAKPNGGVSSARNAGIRAATGRYINFLDADDKWDPDACRAALDFFERHPEVNLACFPIMFFDRYEGSRQLSNYKFKQTRVADILQDADYALSHVHACFIRSHVANRRPFDEGLTISEDLAWLGLTLLAERHFGVIAAPSYRYRKRFDHSSAIDSKNRDLSYYLTVPHLCFQNILHCAQEQYGEIIPWAQHDVMLDLTWRIKEEENDRLTSAQKDAYREMMRTLLSRIDDQIILTVRNLWTEERLSALSLKHGMTYEQTQEWVKPDEAKNALAFCRPGEPALKLADIPPLRLEFMDIAEGRLLLRGSCAIRASRERTKLVVIVGCSDGSIRECPCELFRRPDLRKRFLLGGEIWSFEGFEFSLPLAGKAEVRAVVEIDGIRFELQWHHVHLSPFARGDEASYLARAGYVVGKLPDDRGLCLASWTSALAREREQAFLRQVARQKTDTPSALVARIRRAGRRMRRLSKRPIWLLCDRVASGGDNGEALFEYLMTHPAARREIRPVFALSRDSEDWERLRRIGPTVAYGSIPHKILFLAADKLVSSSADDAVINPFGKDDRLYRDLFNFDFVFLQHGVIKDDLSRWLHQIHKNIALFVTSAERERQSVVAGEYGYTAEQVILSGLPRHDKLLRRATVEKPRRLVAVMPTWRRDLVIDLSLPNPALEASEYFRFWNGLLNHPRLLEALRDCGHRLRFAIHPRFTREARKFRAHDPVDVVLHCDYSRTFCEAALLLTDYSSVAFDFALLKKPIVYAQFDDDTFYRGHTYAKGYFEYARDGFGPVCGDLETTIDAVIRCLENGCEMEPMYRERVDDFFGVQPENRCQAVADAIKKLGRRPAF